MKNNFLLIFIILLTAVIASSATYLYLVRINNRTSLLTPTSSPRFQAGLEKLNYLYANTSELIYDSSFVVDLKGKIKSISSNNLTIEANNQQYSVDITSKDRQLRFFAAKDESSPPKPISSNDLQGGDVAKVQLRINPVNGNTTVLFVTKVVK